MTTKIEDLTSGEMHARMHPKLRPLRPDVIPVLRKTADMIENFLTDRQDTAISSLGRCARLARMSTDETFGGRPIHESWPMLRDTTNMARLLLTDRHNVLHHAAIEVQSGVLDLVSMITGSRFPMPEPLSGHEYEGELDDTTADYWLWWLEDTLHHLENEQRRAALELSRLLG